MSKQFFMIHKSLQLRWILHSIEMAVGGIVVFLHLLTFDNFLNIFLYNFIVFLKSEIWEKFKPKFVICSLAIPVYLTTHWPENKEK